MNGLGIISCCRVNFEAGLFDWRDSDLVLQSSAESVQFGSAMIWYRFVADLTEWRFGGDLVMEQRLEG